MGKQRRQRSWFRLLVTSVIAGVGLAALRSLMRPSASPAVTAPPSAGTPNGSAAVHEDSSPTVALLKAPTVSEPVDTHEAPPDPPLAALQPEYEPVLDVAAAGSATPQLAFVAEPTTPMYMPPADRPPSGEPSRWDPPTSPEWLPGFGPTGQHAVDPWSSTIATPPVLPIDTPPLDDSGAVSGIRGRLHEWRHQTPRKQMVYTIVGTLCLVAAIVATVLVLAL